MLGAAGSRIRATVELALAVLWGIFGDNQVRGFMALCQVLCPQLYKVRSANFMTREL